MTIDRGYALAFFISLLSAPVSGDQTPPARPPAFDHIVVVIEENKNFEHVVDFAAAPFINHLVAEGALLTQAYGEEHNSEGNYFWLFSGSRFSLRFDDTIPSEPLDASNLGQQLIDHGKSFKGYAEDLPEIGSSDILSPQPPCGGNCGYARKHVPWASFPALCRTKTTQGCANLPFTAFPKDFSTLPTVSFVVPNLIHDMHSVASKSTVGGKNAVETEVAQGDAWLKENFDGYYQWAKSHNSLLIVTFDENENTSGMSGPTDPAASTDPVKQNRIATVLAGAHIKQGRYPEGAGVNHVNILRTIEAMYGLPRSGQQEPHAGAAGLSDNTIITDVFD